MSDVRTEDDQYLTMGIFSLVLESALNLEKPTKDSLSYYLGEKRDYIQTITVKMPEEWSIENQTKEIKNENFDYSYSSYYQNNDVVIKHRFFLKDNEVKFENLEATLNDLESISEIISYQLNYNKLLINENGNNMAWQAIFILIIGLLIGIFLLNKINKNYNPIKDHQKNALKIGGWLILPTIGLIITPFVLIRDLIAFSDDGIYISSTWDVLWSEGEYGVIIFLIIIGLLNIFFLVSSLYLIYILFKRRSSFPVLIISFYIFTFIVILSDSFVSYAYDSTSNIWSREVYNAMLTCVTWIPYFLMSQRVKDTFVYNK